MATVDVAVSSRARGIERTRGMRQTRLIKNIVVTILLVVGGVIMATPFLWLVSSSLKEPSKIWLYPPQIIPNPIRWQNYPEALTTMPFHLFFINTMTIVIFDEIGILFTSSLAAYSFARLRFRGRDFVFFMLLSTMMLPWAVTMIPRYIMFRQLGWVNTFLPLIVPNYFGGGAFNIFLLRQFFRTIPYEISDAGRIDGCSEFSIYWRLVLPLARPALATVAIFTFLNAWNDFMGPLIYLTSPNKRTLSLGLAAFRDLYTTQWHYLMAASTVVILPVILLFFAAQRYFVQGIAFTGLKG